MQQNTFRKALWCQQDYPDNHTDDKFLESLVINADIAHRSFPRVVLAALNVDQQVCAAALVASVAYHLYQNTINVQVLLLWETGLLLAGSSLLALFVRPPPSLLTSLRNGVSIFVLIAITALLSPMYGTLTASISPDTIVACTTVLLLSHLYLHDYRQNSLGIPTLRGSFGLASAMCASVLMASQLGSLEHVFSLMVLSLEVYILGPRLHRMLAESAPLLHIAVLVVQVAASFKMVYAASVVLCSGLACTLCCITILCPMWLVRIQKFKAKINGPWDQAAPVLSSSATD